MYLVISTLPHFYSIVPLVKYYKNQTFGYINTIILSTILSILYHAYGESNHIINTLDYLAATIWFSYDIYIGYTYTNRKTVFKIVLGNGIMFCINTQIAYNSYYILNHSLWHLINAYKCVYVSNHIAMGLKAPSSIL